ncbi:MAG: HAD family phosphatase [Holophagales bacterium]|nr:HAD family phosphatase [Holophagales bacterium]
MELRAVLFDMDGVLVFSEDAWFAVYNRMLVQFGRAPVPRAEFDAIYGNGATADRDAYLPDRTVEEIEAAYASLFEEHLGQVRPNVEAKGVLVELRRRGIRIAVATNTTAPLARRILDLQGLLPLVDATASANEAGAGKPDPAVVRLAAERVGTPLSQCLFVGDSRFDAQAAAAAPVRFVGLGHGDGERIERLGEILDLVPDPSLR